MKIFADYAPRYAALGWSVFPLAVGQKIPLIKDGGGFKSATADLDQIDWWAHQCPNANIGIATGEMSGVTVIDVDPRHGGDKLIEKYAQSGRPLPQTVAARSCQGGTHYFFAYEASVQSGANRLGKGVDLKSDGGYVVAAPSFWRENKGSYSWILAPLGGQLPKMPAWAVRQAKMQPVQQKVDLANLPPLDNEGIAKMLDKVRSAPSGNRNNMLNAIGYYLRRSMDRSNISQRDLERRLEEAGTSAGLDAVEIRKTIKSAFIAAGGCSQ